MTARVPPGWVITTIGRVGEVRVGRQRSPHTTSGLQSTKYLRAANITTTGLDLSNLLEMDFSPDERATYELVDGDVVLAEASGSARYVGRSAVWHDEVPGCCFQNTVIRFRPTATTTDYAALVFRHYSASGLFAQASRGMGILHLSGSRFASLAFPLPPIPEQHRITLEVGHRIEELERAQSALRDATIRIAEQRREILSAALSGRLVETDLSIALRERRPAPAAELEMDGQPSSATPQRIDPNTGWVWVRVDEAGEVQLGKMLKPSEHRGPNMRPYLRVANVLEDSIDVTDVKTMHFSPHESDMFALKRGDILLNEGQSPEWVGRPAMYRDEVPDACFQKTLLRFRAGIHVDPEFALLVFLHYLHEGEFKKVAKWSTNIAHLTRRRFVEMRFPMPPLPEQRRIVAAARRRLGDSAAQQTAVRDSLTRIPLMVSEVLAAAVAGTLVPQDASDEPADALLEQPSPSNSPNHKPRREAPRLTSPRPPSVGNDDTVPTSDPPPRTVDLAAILRAAGKPLEVVELFRRAALDPNLTDDIETFYLVLRAQLGTKLRLLPGARENPTVEAIDNAP